MAVARLAAGAIESALAAIELNSTAAGADPVRIAGGRLPIVHFIAATTAPLQSATGHRQLAIEFVLAPPYDA